MSVIDLKMEIDRILGVYKSMPELVLIKLKDGRFGRLDLREINNRFFCQISKSTYNLLRGGNTLLKDIPESKVKEVYEVIESGNIDIFEDNFNILEADDPAIEKEPIRIIKGV